MVIAYVRLEAASEETVQKGIKRLKKKITCTKISDILGDDRFVCVCEIEDDRAPKDLQEAVSKAVGRMSASLIIYDRFAINLPNIIIPAPVIENDPSTAKALAQIAPELKHPLSGEKMENITS